MRNIIASLDLGTSYVKLVVGEIYKGKLNILASSLTPSRGIKGGFIVNVESATDSIKETFDKVNEKLGFKITKVVVNIPSYGLSSFLTTASMNFENKIITEEDVLKMLDNCLKDKISPSFELVALTPTYFVINDTEKVDNPVGMSASKLFLKAVGNVVPKKNINLITKCLQSLNIEVVDKVVNPISDFYEFANKNMLESNGAVVNIGSVKTEVSIFNKGILVSSETLSVGSISIEQILSYNYKISKNDAIYLKENLVILDKNATNPAEFITFDTKNGDVVRVNQYDASLFAIEKMVEILNLVKKQINLLTKKQISYIIVTGGVSELAEFEFLLDEVFNRKAKLCKVNEIGIRSNIYSSCAGLIKYYNKKLKTYNLDFSLFSYEDLEEFSGLNKKVNISGSSLLGKLLGIFYDS